MTISFKVWIKYMTGPLKTTNIPLHPTLTRDKSVIQFGPSQLLIDNQFDAKVIVGQPATFCLSITSAS